MTRSPLALVREALEVAQETLPAYSSPFSRKDFTQHQLFAILVLREFLKVDYRGIITILSEWSDMRRALRLKKVPNYSTLCYAHQRMSKKGAMRSSCATSSTEP